MDNDNLYNSPYVANRIKSYAKSKNISLKDILLSCSLGTNTFSHMLHGRSLAFDSLAKIADCLDCSVDYLLGRTDNPEINKSNNIETYIPKTNVPTLPPRRIAALGADETKQTDSPAPRRIT